MARILVVDDDVDILDLITGMLTPEHEVIRAADATSALETIRRTPIDLLVTDIRMPCHSGFTLINQAKAIRPQLRVILVSGYYDETDEVARKIVHEYAPIALCKPITRATVVAAVAAALPG